MNKPKVYRWILPCLIPLALVGCSKVEDTAPTVLSRGGTQAEVSETPPNRFEVIRVQVFRDELAYGNTRGVYVIRDLKTGAEYVGVSGVGVTELGSHSVGKTRSSDER